MLRRSASGLFALVLAGALVAPGSAGTGAPRQQPPPEGQAAQPPPDQPRPPVIRRGINYVSVDIIVTDRQGNPVTDLKPEDFEISEEGERQTIESFELVRVDQAVPTGAIRSTTDVEREVARPDVRIFAIFLDDYHVRRGADLRVREPLARFLQQHLAPTDLVGVMYPLTPIGDFQLTRDHEAVVSAVTQFLGRKYDYEPRNAFEERYMYYPAAVVERIRNQVTLSALKALVTHLGGLREGRKAVILVSEGFTNTLPPQLSDPIAAAPGIGNPNRRRNTQILEEDPRYQAQQFFENVDLQADLREVYAAANRANTSIYALDPRGLGGFEFDIGDGVSLTMDRRIGDNTRDTLMVLANETDGRAIVNRNDLDAGLRQVVRDLSSYYLVGYSSTRSPTDGKFHRIEVKVRRPGLQVRARKGYWALTAEAAARATAPPAPGPPPEVGKALAAIATPRGRMVRTWVGTTRAEEGRTRVTFVWEAVAPAVRAADAEPPARVTLTAVAASGDPVFRGPVPAASPPGASPSSAAGDGRSAPGRASAAAQFEAPPGRLQLRFNVESAAGEVLDSDVRDLTVPDYTEPGVHLSTPALLRARTPRELEAVRADPEAVPTAAREFRRTERILVRFEAYAPGGQPASPAVRLLNRQGQAMSELPTTAGPGPGLFQAEVPLAGLAPGEYLLEVRATAGAGEAKELVAIRLTS